MKLRRIFAVILAAALLVSVIPGNFLVSADETQMTQINVSDAYVWGYAGDGGNAKTMHQTFEDIRANGLNKNEYNGGGTKTSYVQYAVEAPADGEYAIEAGVSIGSSYGDNPLKDEAENPYIAILVNDVVYKGEIPKENVGTNWGSVDSSISLNVSLKKGVNLIRCTSLPKGQKAFELNGANNQYLWCNQNYLKIDSRLTAYTGAETKIDTNENEGYTVANKAAKQSDKVEMSGTLADEVKGKNLTIQGITPDNIGDYPYLALKVNAPKDGYYDITVGTAGWFNGSAHTDNWLGEATQIGMVVDGKASVVKVDTGPNDGSENEYADASCYLTAGEHIIFFTIPLPENDADATEFYGKNDRWLNYKSIILGNGLAPVTGLSNAEVMDSVGGFTHIQAENSVLTVLNGYTVDGTVVGGVGTGKQRYSYDELQQFLDKQDYGDSDSQGRHTAYVQYTVEAPADGEYEMKVGVNTGGKDSSALTETPYIVVLVNQTAYKGEIPRDRVGTNWGSQDYGIPLRVTLKKGLNLIRCTAFPKGQQVFDLDQSGESFWCNHDYLAIEKRLAPAGGAEVTVQATDTSYVVSNLYTAAQDDQNIAILGDAKTGALARNRFSIEDVSPKTLRYIPHFAVKVNAPMDGYYDITVKGNNDPGLGYMAMTVDGKPSARKICTNGSWRSTMDTSAYLTRGEHVLAFTLDLPRNSEEAKAFDYQWMNFYSVSLGNGLTPVQGLTADEVMSSGNMEGTRLEAEDAVWNGYNNAADNGDASGGKVVEGAGNGPLGQTLDELKQGLDKSYMPYIQYTLDAPEDGEYSLALGFLVGSTNPELLTEIPYAAVLVNDTDVYQAKFLGEMGMISESEIRVSLKKGRNVIRVTGLTSDQQAWKLDTDNVNHSGVYCWLNQDYLTVDARLTAVTDQRQTIDAGNETFTVFNKYTKNGDNTLGGADYDAVREKKISIQDVSGRTLRYIPYVALKVHAPVDGYYDLTVQAGNNFERTEQIALVVDGVAEARKISVKNVEGWPSTVDASCHLSQGDHILVFTLPLPADSQEAESYEYDWMDYKRLVLGSGLTAVQGLTAAEVMASGNLEGTRIEAEDAVWNGYNNTEDNTAASGGKVVVGAGNQAGHGQTFEELKQGLDKAWTSYVQYTVDAPADGEYTLAVGYLVDSTSRDAVTEKPYAAVLVNDQVYQAPYQEMIGEFNESVIRVKMKKGRNVVRATGLTRDQKAWQIDTEENGIYCWLNHDYLTVDSRLTVVNAGQQVIHAADTDYTVYNRYTPNGDTLGGAAYDTITRNSISMADVNTQNLKYIPFVACKVKASADGYYDITVKCNTEDRPEGRKAALLVDGVLSERMIGMREWDDRLDGSCYLTRGEHILVVTVPLPSTGWQAKDYDYTWMDISALELGNGLTAVKGLKKNEVMKDLAFDGIRLEAENAVWNNYKFAEEAEDASGGKVAAGAAGGSQKQTFEELGRFLDKTDTAYVQYAVMAPADGEYTLGLGIQVNTTENHGNVLTEVPYSAVLINDQPYKAYFRGNLGQTYESVLKVHMKKGLNIIRCTSYTIDQQAWKVDNDNENYPDIWSWMNQDYLTVDSRLTPVEDHELSSVKAGDKEKVAYNLYVEDLDTGGVHFGRFKGVRASKIYIDGLDKSQLYKVPYISFEIQVPVDGYYDMSVITNVCDNLNEATVGLGGVNHMAMLVDGNTRTLSFRSLSNRDVIDASGYYTAGRHSVLVTLPLPRTAEEAQYAEYEWCDFLSIETRNGMTVATDYVKYEVEDYAWTNLCKVGENKNYSGGAYVGSASFHEGYTVDRMMNDVDLYETSHMEFQVEASEAGTYHFLVDIMHGKWGEADQYREAYFVVECNGERQKISQYVDEDIIYDVRTPVDVSLKKGKNTLRISFYTGDTVAKEGNVWNDFDAVEVDRAQAEKLRFVNPSDSYVTLEAEDYAMTNLCARGENESYSNGGHVGGARNLNAQSASQIMQDGIDATRTSYAEFAVEAQAAGEYTLLFGIAQGKWGEAEKFRQAHTVVECNGKRQLLTRPVAGNIPFEGRVVAKLKLNKGLNTIRVTLCTADVVAQGDGGSVWVDYDTIIMRRSEAAKLNFLAVSGITEAETQEYDAYNRMIMENSSNGYCLGGAEYNFVEDGDYTFENLTAENIMNIPYVMYTVKADRAGTYNLGIRFNGSSDSYTAKELKELGNIAFAMSVNGKEPQKVEFAPELDMYNTVRLVETELQEGENTILLTCTTAEYINNVANPGAKDYRLYWVDHDAMYLYGGVHNLNGEGILGIETTNIGDPQLSVHQGTGGKSEASAGAEPVIEEESAVSTVLVLGILGGCAAAAAGGCGAVYYFGRKKRIALQKEQKKGNL